MTDDKKHAREKTLDPNAVLKREMAGRTRRSFLIGGVAAVAGYGFYRWIDRATPIGELQTPLRRAEEYDAGLSRALFDEKGRAPEYDRSAAVADLRFNGNFGLDTELNLNTWRLQLIGLENPKQYRQYTDDVDLWDYQSGDTPEDSSQAPAQENLKVAPTPFGQADRAAAAAAQPDAAFKQTPGILLTIDDVKALPFHEQVTQFKCIEGWSEIVYWGGARMADLVKRYKPAKVDGRDPKYVYMETPDGEYFVGLDYTSVMHPQTLLVYQMSGRPINKWHGAPLRLCMPLKYGYKQIKQIAKFEFTDKRPKDYWAQLGYDWYAGF